MIELKKNLEQAKKILKTPNCRFLLNTHELVDELTELNIGNSEEVWPLLYQLLEEINPEHCTKQNVTKYLSSKLRMLGCESFIFKWKSTLLQSNITLKFALNESHFYYISVKKI